MSTGGRQLRLPRPPLHSKTPTHRSVTDARKRHELGLPVRTDTSSATTSVPGASVFEFTRLPVEIRRMIYLHALTSYDSLDFLPPRSIDVKHQFIAHLADDFPTFAVSLLCTSKAIYAEAWQILYSENTFHFYIGTARTGNAPMIPYGPSPFNTSLALAEHVLRLIRDLRITLVTERSTHYLFIERAKGVSDFARLHTWITIFAEALSMGRAQGASLRNLVIDHRRGEKESLADLSGIQQFGPPCDPERLVEEDEHMLDGLKNVLRGVGQVTLIGEFTDAYRREFLEQVMRPL